MRRPQEDHPLGTPGASALRRAREEAATKPLLGIAAKLLPGLAPAGASWRRGAEGEVKVARRLGALPKDDWLPLHDRPLGPNGRNVDHLLIGRGGVFSVNSKNLSGSVVVTKNALVMSGYRDYRVIHAARDEARRVSARLSAALGAPVDVTPVIVVLAATFDVVEQPRDVQVLGFREVPRWFEARPRVLDLPVASRVYGACRRSDVWTAPVETLRQAPARDAAPAGLTVDPWRRWGHDRLYVNDSEGNSLGYLDRKTGDIVVEDLSRKHALRAMLVPHLSR